MTSRSDNTRSRGRRGAVSRGRSSRENAGEGTSSRGVSGPRRNHKWTPRTTRIFLELVIAELEAEDYTIRVPLAAGKRRIEEKFVELTGDSVKWEPEMKSKFNYLKKLWYFNNILSKRTGTHVDSSGQIEMEPSWWNDRCAEFGETNKKYITVLMLPRWTNFSSLFGIDSPRSVGSSSANAPEMINFFNRPNENDGKKK
ncbi:hypothetical protein ISN44_As06g045390 [Arabidopsis suecica]|uniref:Myb/SANT-like domain-containing protein n=1 Tax=Arabidopsis suecica TaxID=45249 RepID=A0A8T2CU97_ARASU|nr:hypothetical protein ISN44_As06g045390 [Arabidopsis suecica]